MPTDGVTPSAATEAKSKAVAGGIDRDGADAALARGGPIRQDLATSCGRHATRLAPRPSSNST